MSYKLNYVINSLLNNVRLIFTTFKRDTTVLLPDTITAAAVAESLTAATRTQCELKYLLLSCNEVSSVAFGAEKYFFVDTELFGATTFLSSCKTGNMLEVLLVTYLNFCLPPPVGKF